MKKVRLFDTYLECGLRFFIFSKERLQNVKKLITKVGCTFSRAVRARAHVHAHKHYKSTRETPRNLS